MCCLLWWNDYIAHETTAIMYVDDIILIAASAGVLQKLLHKCETLLVRNVN